MLKTLTALWSSVFVRRSTDSALVPVVEPAPKPIPVEIVTTAEDDPRYCVVYFPDAGRWYALYKKRYLRKWYSTGIVEPVSAILGNSPVYAESCSSEQQAWGLCNRHRSGGTAFVYTKPSWRK